MEAEGMVVDVDPIQILYILDVKINIGEHYLTGETKKGSIYEYNRPINIYEQIMLLFKILF
jgi:hypothetical protein